MIIGKVRSALNFLCRYHNWTMTHAGVNSVIKYLNSPVNSPQLAVTSSNVHTLLTRSTSCEWFLSQAIQYCRSLFVRVVVYLKSTT